MPETDINKELTVSLSEDHNTIMIENGKSNVIVGVVDIPILVTLLAQATARLGSPEATTIFPVEWWQVLPDVESPENFLLHFRVNTNFQLAFRIHRDRGRKYIAALESLLAQPISSSSKASH
jgi:hypothetical protein